MNQRRRPQMPPQAPRPQMPPQGGRSGHFYPYYHNWVWDDHYDWDDWYYDWDDWDHYYGANPARAPKPMPTPPNPMPTPPTPKPKVTQCLKVAPLLMINLLEHAYKEVQSESELQDMLTNMMNISISSWGQELTMGDYEDIIGMGTYTITPKTTPSTPPKE